MKCPICNSNKSIELLNLDGGKLDNSMLYNTIKIVECKNCGHVYNELYNGEENDLIEYYNIEYASSNLSSMVENIGDRPGSNNEFTINRYEQLFKMISRNLTKDSRILDVGCAKGGFLDFLNKKGFKNLFGIDVIKQYVDYCKDHYNYNIKLGTVYSIPHEDDSFDVIILDQVIEHLINVREAIVEIKRVLSKGGYLCIGIPDASRYKDSHFFDYYMFLMKEHVQHFDLEHLQMLLNQESFDLESFTKSEIPMMSDKMVLPNLYAVFYLNKRRKYFKLGNEIKLYINNQFIELDKKKKTISKLVIYQKPLYVWGIGREFLYLYENAGLKYCNIVGLIDDVTFKQNFSVNGKKITDSSILKNRVPHSVLIITAFAHVEKIKNKALQIGYDGEILDV